MFYNLVPVYIHCKILFYQIRLSLTYKKIILIISDTVLLMHVFLFRFLCEYIYYTSLSIDPGRTVFVHVPVLDKPYTAQQIAQGLSEIIALLVEQLRSANSDHKDNYLPPTKNEL